MESHSKSACVTNEMSHIDETEINSLQDPESDEQSIQKPNPMDNPLILLHLFDQCHSTELAKFRLVSKHWKNLCLPYWRNTVRLPFDESIFYDDHGAFWTFNGLSSINPNVTSMEKFLEFIEDPKNECERKPYRNFRLKDWDFERNSKLATKFWKACGDNITTLQLLHCTFAGVDDFRNIIYNCCPQLQNLIIEEYRVSDRDYNAPQEQSEYTPPKHGENLHLKSICIDMGYKCLPVSWMELFSHFPSINNITIYNALVPDSLKAMLVTIYRIKRKDKRKLPVKHLNLLSTSRYAQETFPKDLYEILNDLKFPLESLNVDFGIETPENLIRDILNLYASTLKKLNVYRGVISYPYKDFPFGVDLNNLQEIVMSEKLCDNLEFLRHTPNLQKFHLDYTTDCSYPYINSDIVKNTKKEKMDNFKLTKLTELYVGYGLSECDLLHLVTWMPNLERLKMKLDDKQFAIVCEHWRSLNYMRVLGIDLTDEGVTGRLIKNHTGAVLEESVSRPNITYLKCLRTFVLKGYGVLYTGITEISAYEGFLKVSSLEDLNISSQMGDEAKNALKKKIVNCQINSIKETIADDNENW